MGCKKCKEKREKLLQQKREFVQLLVKNPEQDYYLIVDKNTSQVVEKCFSLWPDIPLVESVKIAR